MKILWRRDEGCISFDRKEIQVTCIVRNEVNGYRGVNEIVYTIPEDGAAGVPYQPREFPLGTWKITECVESKNPQYAPYFIRTNAKQLVEEWELRPNTTTGRDEYYKPTGHTVVDTGYGLHHSKYYNGHIWKRSSTTLGCGNIVSEFDVIFLVTEINKLLKAGDPVELEVRE